MNSPVADAMRPTPPGWPRISSGIFYRDASKMIDWLCYAFGFELRLKVDGDVVNGDVSVAHSELTYGEGLVMVGSEKYGAKSAFGVNCQSPVSVGANTQTMMLFVDDVDLHCAQARAAGAKIVDEPRVHDYGEDFWADRSYGVLDPEGHMWWFTQRIRDQTSTNIT